MSNKDYGQIMCEAVDTIIAKRLNGISYDQTVLCTIVDNTNKAQGKYIVQKDNVKFEVYSTNTEYNKNDNVYVQIPEGDQNQDKFIIGKKINSNNQESYVYNKPFNNLVDITGNIATNSISGNSTGLIANGELEYIDLWSYQGEVLTEYTRLGIQASFQSWLNPFTDTNGEIRRVTKGEYGLELTIKVEEQDTQSGNPLLFNKYVLYLNTNDMNGNPYEFDTYFQQEKVFDISQFKNITEMTLRFYQKKNSFKDSEEVLLPVYTADNDITKPQSTSNLFVNDIYICVGYDVNDFTDEKIQIYSLNSSTYIEEAKDNKKLLQLRWIHKQEDGSFKSITADDKLEFEVRWYRYKLGSPSADSYSGVYWKYLSTQNNTEYLIKDEDWIKYNKENEEDINPTFFTSYLFPNYDKAQEQIKAILLYNGQVLRSNILTFTNEKEVVNDATLDAINSVNALQIHCSDGTFGNYRIYGDNNYLVNNGNAGIERKFVAYFSEDPEATPAILTEAEKITWTIPAKNTMIKIADNITANEDGNYYITHEQDKDGHIANEQNYYINRYYSPSLVNNTIQCEIIKNGRTYKTSKELSFGVMGTTGTTCTLVLDFEHPGQNGIQINNDDEQVDKIKEYTIVANLYDADNKNITNEALDKTWSWDWYKGSTGNITIASNNENFPIDSIAVNKCVLEKNTTSIDGTQWNILQCTLKGWGDFDLIAYLPIPLKWEIVGTCVPLYLEGTDIIVYNTEGLADYYKGSYKLIDVNNTSQDNFAWSINESDDPFGPQLTKNNAIQASNVYIEDSTKGFVVNCKYEDTIVWSQPLLIIQNRYPNSTINQWDGNFTVDNGDNELLAARIAAGIKNKDNTFTGVAIGDWQFDTNDKKTGIYGFHQGAMSYAFKDNGEAFIGKDGKGRIVFKGDSGDIHSDTWESTISETNKIENLGMLLDINKGAIKMASAKETQDSTEDKPKYEVIENEDGSKSLIKRYIDIDVKAKIYPLAIGADNVDERPFKVNWDGKLFVSDGEFKGEIIASSGSIGAWTIDDNGNLIGTAGFNNQNIILSATEGYIYGAGINCYAGNIGGWQIINNSLSTGGIVLNSEIKDDDNIITQEAGIIAKNGLNLDGYFLFPIVKNSLRGYIGVSNKGLDFKFQDYVTNADNSKIWTDGVKLSLEDQTFSLSGNATTLIDFQFNNGQNITFNNTGSTKFGNGETSAFKAQGQTIELGTETYNIYDNFILSSKIGSEITIGTDAIDALLTVSTQPSVLYLKGTIVIGTEENNYSSMTRFYGNVDFSGADVTGLPESDSSSEPVYAILA